MLTKYELREQAKKIRSLLYTDKISESIVKNIRETELYQTAQHIMIFYPLPGEINLLPLLKDNKNFYLPKVAGDELLVCPYKEGGKLSVSGFKTQEPLTEPVNSDIPDIIFVPALMVDKEFHRLGYGRGFYDRFLLKHALQAIRIVPIASELIRDNIPFDAFDAQFDVIIDEL